VPVLAAMRHFAETLRQRGLKVDVRLDAPENTGGWRMELAGQSSLAESEGFEPPGPFRGQRFSRPPH
jgi:deoxyribodipyrimidine photolyase-like uncharacterized protein